MANLHDLRRQRELVAQHLAWLDGEIQALQGGTPAQPLSLPPPLPAQPPPASASNSASTLPSPAADAVTHQVIEQYQAQAANTPADARRGCLIIFGSVVTALVVTVVAIYFLKYR